MDGQGGPVAEGGGGVGLTDQGLADQKAADAACERLADVVE